MHNTKPDALYWIVSAARPLVTRKTRWRFNTFEEAEVFVQRRFPNQTMTTRARLVWQNKGEDLLISPAKDPKKLALVLRKRTALVGIRRHICKLWGIPVNTPVEKLIFILQEEEPVLYQMKLANMRKELNEPA